MSISSDFQISIIIVNDASNHDRLDEEKDFEQRFTFFFDYPAEVQLSSVKSEAHEVLFERITQDIFNTSLANW